MEKWKYENIPAFRYHPLGSANFLFIFYAAPSPYHRLRFPFNAFLIYDFLVFFLSLENACTLFFLISKAIYLKVI